MKTAKYVLVVPWLLFRYLAATPFMLVAVGADHFGDDEAWDKWSNRVDRIIGW